MFQNKLFKVSCLLNNIFIGKFVMFYYLFKLKYERLILTFTILPCFSKQLEHQPFNLAFNFCPLLSLCTS